MAKLSEKEEESFLGKAYALKHQDETNALYETWQETYDGDMESGGYHQPKRVAAAVKASGLVTNAHILDVGCGTGLSGLALKALGYENLDGNDISQAMLDKAEATAAFKSLSIADLNKPPLPIEDAQFDAITAVGVFSYGHVMPDAIDELLRMLKPEGLLFIGINGYFYEESGLKPKLEDLDQAGIINTLDQQLGIHMKSTGTQGWVVTVQKV